MPEPQVIKTNCGLCIEQCGINVHLEKGRIVRVEGMPEHPISQGYLCPKGAAAIDYEYSLERLNYPMKRENGAWKRISWEEALETIAAKLIETKEAYGAKALVVLVGMPVLLSGPPGISLLRRFCDVYGTPNYFSVDSMCFRPRVVAYFLTYGKYLYPAEPQNSRLILLWGHNPDASSPLTARQIRSAKGKGVKLIVIDPRRVPLAKEADIWVQPRPGSDCALALGMLNVIISENLYDTEFVEKWTFGFDRLAEHIKSYTPQEVEKITWVSAENIREIARIYAATKPACIYQGTSALDQTASGFQSARAIAILQAITNNIDVPGGFARCGALWQNPARLIDMVKERAVEEEKYPLAYTVWGRWIGEGQGMGVPNAILTGNPYAIKAMIVAGSNPALTWPDSRKIKEALEKLDFLVVMSISMSQTAQLAHIVLPAATFLEKTDLVDRGILGLPYAMLRKKVIQFEESWADAEFWLQLAKKMGYDQYFPWKNTEEFLDYILEPSGLTVELLTKGKPEGIMYGTWRYGEYKERGVPTPSGKVEIYSETMEKLGYDPLPTYAEPIESPVSTPEVAKDYPLILTTGARMLPYLHSQLRNISKLRRLAPEPLAEIHPDTAEKWGIKDDEMILVETRRGYIQIKARLTPDIALKVVNIPHGWEQANVNILTFAKPGDPISGVPNLKAMLCRVKKLC